MQKNEVTLTLEIKSNDLFDFKEKKKLLENLARLDSSKLNYLNELSKVDNTTLQNLAELTSSPKIIEKSNSKIGFIKTFMG